MDAFNMGGYGVYVWASYGFFAAALLWDAIAAPLRSRRVLRAVTRRQARAAARQTP